MSEQPSWEEWVNKLKEMFKFITDFNLVQHFQELHLCTEPRDLHRAELRNGSEELKQQEKEKNKEIRKLEKAQSLHASHSEVSVAIQNTIQKLSDVSLGISMPQRYSKPMVYISRLCAIFYEGTGQMPVVSLVKKNASYESGEHKRYSGNFYEFLLEAAPLLAEIGIVLSDKYETIGKYAWQVVNGDKKGGIISFSDLQKEIEIDKREIEEIKKELFLLIP